MKIEELSVDDRVWIDPDAPTECAGMPAQVWGFALDGRVSLLVPIIGLPTDRRYPGSRWVKLEAKHVVKDTDEDREELLDQHGEREWMKGNRAAWRRLLQMACGELRAMGEGIDVTKEAIAIGELHDTRLAVRELCKDIDARSGYADYQRPSYQVSNSWDDRLHLGDVVTKHVANTVDKILDELIDLREQCEFLAAKVEKAGV